MNIKRECDVFTSRTIFEVCWYYIDGYKLFNCEVLIYILYLDCGFLNVRVNLFFTSSHESVYLKADSSNKNRIQMPAGLGKPNDK